MQKISITEGRNFFGKDPVSYAQARPEYPEALYQRLMERCGTLSNAEVFEIGAGTGLATQRLLQLKLSHLHIIEPDMRLTEYLKQTITDERVIIHASAFEDADLIDAAYDAGVAATSFHWLEQQTALQKVFRALKPGGWWAMWWTQFGADSEYDAFQKATDHLFVNTPRSPSLGDQGRPPFALDQEARKHDLRSAGFVDIEAVEWKWTRMYTTSALVKLYNTFSPLMALSNDERAKFFDELVKVAEQQFNGQIERPFKTILYTAQRP